METRGSGGGRWRRLGGILRDAALALFLSWGVLAIHFSPLPGPAFRTALAGLFGGGALAAAIFLRKRLRVRAWLAGAGAAVLAGWLTIRPSLDRDWSPDQAVLPQIEIEGERVTIRNVRDFIYRSADDYTPRYVDRTVRLADLRSVDFVLERFPGLPGVAHTFLSFGFADGAHVAVSVEIRKEKGERYSPLRGLFRQYELMYVIAEERDLIGLRANHRKDEVYLFPGRATPENRRALFLDVLGRAAALSRRPEFYNTLASTCTTNLVAHINRISPRRVPFSLKTLLPERSDRLAYDLGLIDTDLPYEKIRERYRINEAAERCRDREDFSRGIREGR